MSWDEKKSERTHIRLTPRVKAAADDCAMNERRSLQDQLGVFAEEGLLRRGYFANGNKAGNGSAVSPIVATEDFKLTGPEPIVAKKRPVSQKRTA